VIISSYGKIHMRRFWTGFWNDTRGQDLVEYALAAGLVAVVAVAAMPTLSNTVSNVFAKIGSVINATVT
jgi:pilus assembly protein Flp/PilA